jgi:hypothetical protein
MSNNNPNNFSSDNNQEESFYHVNSIKPVITKKVVQEMDNINSDNKSTENFTNNIINTDISQIPHIPQTTTDINNISNINNGTVDSIYTNNTNQNTNKGNAYFEGISFEDPSVVTNNKTQTLVNQLKQRWNIIYNFLQKRWWLALLVAIAICILFVSVFAFFILRDDSSNNIPNISNVTARIEAPETLAKGNPGDWKIYIENKENSAMQNIQVNLTFDRSFEFSKAISPSPDRFQGDRYIIPRLDPVGQGIDKAIIQFQGITKGNVDEEIVMQGDITYTPDEYVKLQNAGKIDKNTDIRKKLPLVPVKTRTTAAKINIIMTAKEENVPNNSDAEFTVLFKNTSERDIRDLRIFVTYPQGFAYGASELRQDNFSSARNQPDDSNNIWNLSSFQRLGEQNLSFRGKVSGANGTKLPFKVEMQLKNGDTWQTIATTVRDITVTGRPLTLSTYIDNKYNNAAIKPGETLTFVIKYENQGIGAIRGAELFGSVQDPANILDWSTAQFTGGSSGNMDNKTVKWTGANIPQLESLGVNVKGELRYSIKVKESSEFIKTFLQQNQYILTPQIAGQAQGINRIENSGPTYKSEGDLDLSQKIEEVVNNQTQPANKKTYRITWSLQTVQNQVNQVTVKTKSTLPTNSFDNLFASITPDSRKNQLSFNNSGDLVWNVGNIVSYTGISNPPAAISFTITTETDVRDLFGDVQINGTDDVTGKAITKTGEGGSVR